MILTPMPEVVTLPHLVTVTEMAAFRDALAEYPTLCHIGFGLGIYQEPLIEKEAKLARSRFALEDSIPQVQTAMEFLMRCEVIGTPLRGSYEMKHRAEKWGGRHGFVSYVSNGAFIAAALALQFPVKPTDSRSLDLKWLGHASANAWIGISKRSVKAMWESQ